MILLLVKTLLSLWNNALQTKSDKFVKPREPIDFAAYKSKLTLTKSGYDYLEVTEEVRK